MESLEKLKELYSRESKHSNYQVLPERLAKIIGTEQIVVKTRYEVQRLKYILNNIDVKDKTFLDIGGNTGYFTFEVIDRGAKRVEYYEGNKVQAEFVRLAARVLGVEEKITVRDRYYNFESERKKVDAALLLNVLHHVGDDYGGSIETATRAKEQIIKQLNSLAGKTEILVFQLGFNWKGNRDIGLFENGTKREMIEFIKDGIKGYWEIYRIGIAGKRGDIVAYHNLDDENIARDGTLGEFLNRPLFIMKTLKN